MYKYLFLIGFCVGLETTAQTTLTLADCFDLAIRNNLQIRQAERQADLGINNYQQSKASQLPSVAGVFNQGYNLGRTIDPYSNDVVTNQIGTNNLGVRADWVLFNGFQQKNILAQQTLQLQADQLDVETAKTNLKLNLLLAYMQVLIADELLEMAHSQAKGTAMKVERIEKMVKLNVVAESNLFDIQAQLSNDKFQITHSQNNLRLAKLKLQQLLNIPLDKTFDIEKIDLQPIGIYKSNPQQVFEAASGSFASIKAAQRRWQAQQKAVDIVAGMRYPTITLSGAWGTAYSSAAMQPIIGEGFNEVPTNQYISIGNSKIPVMQVVPQISSQKIGYFNQLGNNTNLSFGLSLRVPIFNTTQQKYKQQQAQIQKQLAGYEIDATKVQLRQAIEEAFIYKNNAQDRLESVTSQLAIIEKSVQTAEIKLMSGLINPTDYAIGKAQFDKAKADAIQAKYEYLFRIKVLEFYQP